MLVEGSIQPPRSPIWMICEMMDSRWAVLENATRERDKGETRSARSSEQDGDESHIVNSECLAVEFYSL